MLIHLARGRLPWLYVDVKYGDNYINIFNCKRTIQAKELAGSLPPGFISLVDYARNMDSIETPDYEYLRTILLQMAQEKALCGSNNPHGVSDFDWNTNITQKRNLFIKAKSSYHNTKRVTSVPAKKGAKPTKLSEFVNRENNQSQTNSITSCNNFLKVCTNSQSVMGETQFNRLSASKAIPKSRVVVIYEDEDNSKHGDNEEK